jgi:uncharacterized membrane protein
MAGSAEASPTNEAAVMRSPPETFVDNPASPLDNASTEPDRAGSANQGERVSPGPQGGTMASSTPGPTNLGMDPKIASLLCYIPCCLGFIFSIVVAVVEKQSRLVRFNAFQSLLLHAAGIVVLLVLSAMQILLGLVGLGAVSMLVWLVQMVVCVALLALLVILIIKANSGEEFRLPVIGEMAKKWA